MLSLLLVQCRNTEVNTNLGYQYFPLDVQKFWIYQVDSVHFDNFTGGQTSTSSWIKLHIDSTLVDNEGDELYQVSNYWRKKEEHPWTLTHFSYVKKTDRTAERIEFGQREVLMNFPVNDFMNWDRNAFNSEKELYVRFIRQDKPFTVDNQTFDLTVNVEWPEEENSIFHTGSQEVYALYKGLIFEQYINTETQNGKKAGYSFTKKLHKSNW